MADFALQTDGSQNYIDLGAIGTLGSNLGNGFYLKFYINTSSASGKYMGYQEANGQTIEIVWNTNHSEGFANHAICVKIGDNTGKFLQGAADAPSSNFNDGANHLIEIIVVFSTNTITLKIDGVSQTITYQLQQTPATFNNLGQHFYVGAYDNAGVAGNYFAATFDDILIGTSAGALYGNYQMDAGSGTVVADSSGNSNTANLIKGAGSYPSWVSGLAPVAQTALRVRMLGGIGL